MTKEELEKRKKELESGRDQVAASIKQLTANMQAVMGAISDIDYWLGQLAKAEAPVPAKAPSKVEKKK